MKRIFWFAVLVFSACKPNDKIAEQTTQPGDPAIQKQKIEQVRTDSAAGNPEKNRSEMIIDAEKLPTSIHAEFSDDQSKFTLIIKNFHQKKIDAQLIPEREDANIRFNQIRLPDGSFDGPFGRELHRDISGSGTVELIIGKSLMASGSQRGSFQIKVE